MHTSRILQTIADEISPYLGRTMARSSVDLHCRSLKIDAGRAVTAPEVEELLHKLAMGLNIFIGKDKSVSVIDGIRLKIRTVIV